MAKRRVYRVIFNNQGKVYEIYARRASSSEMHGFVEVEREGKGKILQLAGSAEAGAAVSLPPFKPGA